MAAARDLSKCSLHWTSFWSIAKQNIKHGIIMQMTFPGFPWTTSTRLYPEYGLSANPKNVTLDVQEAIVEALYA